MLWSEQYASYNSFVTAREENGRRQFNSFLMYTNDVAESHAMELSHQTMTEVEHAYSLFEAQRQAHEELNAARAGREACHFDAHRRRVEDAFRRTDEAHELRGGTGSPWRRRRRRRRVRQTRRSSSSVV